MPGAEVTDGSALSEPTDACKYASANCTGNLKVCPVCREFFCIDFHSSEVDPEFCMGCLKPADTSVVKEPLIDDEGVTHEGTQQKPVGPAYPSAMKRIAEMTDEQLSLHIQYWEQKLKDAEKVVDYRRIVLGAAKLESDERADANRRKLRGVKVTVNGNKVGVSTGTAGGSQDKKAKLLADALKNMGITDAKKAQAFLMALAAKAKEAKEKAVKPNGGTK